MSEQIKQTFTTEWVPISKLKPHPRNYQAHPDDEIEHIMVSIREHGFYRNIVINKDDTILAGHGVVEASSKLGLKAVPAIRVDYELDDPRALKLLVSDNEIRHLAEVDDRLLTELLKQIRDEDNLLGTGYDDMMLASLAMTTRPASELADLEAASQWVGMPDHDIESNTRIQIIVNFANEKDLQAFCKHIGIDSSKVAKEGTGKSIWWPQQVRDDVISLHFADKEIANA